MWTWGGNCEKFTKQSKGHECGKEMCREKGGDRERQNCRLIRMDFINA